MTKILVGYVLAIGLWIGSVGFVMLALTGADTLPGDQLPITVTLFSLAAVLIILPICLVVWSIRGIKNGTLSKAALGITLIAGLYIAFLVFFIGGKFLSRDAEQVIPRQIPTSQQPSVTSINETASWKTYKNDTYSFGVKYPTTWTSNGYWSENGGFFYVGFGDEDTISTRPPAMLRIYPNQISIDTFKDKVYFQGNWKNTTLGGLPAFETVDMDQTTKRQFIVIVSIRGSDGYELESTVFDDSVDIVRTMGSTFRFLK